VSLRPAATESAARVQRGFALIAILILAALMSAFLIASALNRSSADITNEREDRSMSALRRAKDALIAYAASEQWQLYKGQTPDQPGALPCPDRDDDGDADCTGSNTASMIGRVPFKTLGIEDLRDASGERLWYALSHDYRKNKCPLPPTSPPPGCTIINADTLGQLTVTGTAPATQVVAIVFAPGEVLQNQNRDPANATAHNDPLNYLEGPPNLSDAVNYVFTSAPPSAVFNDRLLVITRADLMAAVEPVVAARIERDVKPLLGDYFSKWGRYPFAVPFASPPAAQSAYLGSSPTTSGLLPVTNTATFAWQNPTVTQIGGMNGSTVDAWSCSISSLTVICTVHYTGGTDPIEARPDIKLQIFLSNVNGAFADAPSSPTLPYNMAMFNGWGNVPTQFGPPYGFFSPVGSITPTWAYVGSALVYTGRLQNALENNYQMTISFPLPAPPGYLPRLSNAALDWFLSNQWYRQTYYAVAPGWAPDGIGACNPPDSTAPPCLTVNNLPAPANNKRAILVLAGRALDGQNHPSGNVPDYLEGQNSTPADLVFEHRAGSPTTINDRVVVVSP
jgi:type II secretory pathway pseudopilin PulG